MPELLLDGEDGRPCEGQVGRMRMPQFVRVHAPLQSGPFGQSREQVPRVAGVGWSPLEGAEQRSPLPLGLQVIARV